MWKKMIATTSLVFALGLAVGTSSAAAATTRAAGDCNMTNANSKGIDGMFGSGLGPGQGNGLEIMLNMLTTSGCFS